MSDTKLPEDLKLKESRKKAGFEDSAKWIFIPICIFLVIWIFFIRMKRNQIQEVKNLPFSNVSIESVEDGTYTGKCTTSFMKVVVEVSVKEHKLQRIDFIENENEVAKKAAVIADSMIEKNKVIVTPLKKMELQCVVIFAAVDDALKKGVPEIISNQAQ